MNHANKTYQLCYLRLNGLFKIYLRADNSLARPGRKQTAPVKSVMGRRID